MAREGTAGAWSSSEKVVRVGSVSMGGAHLPVIQSMTCTDTRDPVATLDQIRRLADAGCEVVRVAIPSQSALDGFGEIATQSPLPVVADIHFDHRLAIEAVARGAAKLRINPGNIGSLDRVDAVIDAAGAAGIPIRIGVNAGSLASSVAERDMPLARKLVESAVEFTHHFDSRGFTDIIVSAKASSVLATVAAYRELAKRVPYPLHIGVTEAGTEFDGTVKSAVGLGILLSEGIGATLRVSLTAHPVREIEAAWSILSALDIRRNRPEMVSCPTCGRCGVDLIPIANEVQRRLAAMAPSLKVAVMGCVVNGPGEAREADFGIACGQGTGVVFARGQEIRRVPEALLVDALFEEIERAVDTL